MLFHYLMKYAPILYSHLVKLIDAIVSVDQGDLEVVVFADAQVVNVTVVGDTFDLHHSLNPSYDVLVSN